MRWATPEPCDTLGEKKERRGDAEDLRPSLHRPAHPTEKGKPDCSASHSQPPSSPDLTCEPPLPRKTRPLASSHRAVTPPTHVGTLGRAGNHTVRAPPRGTNPGPAAHVTHFPHSSLLPPNTPTHPPPPPPGKFPQSDALLLLPPPPCWISSTPHGSLPRPALLTPGPHRRFRRRSRFPRLSLSREP
ncbi:hypothetical protein DAI22_09g099850 [Oryza sativa Japonica Group]|nr:hypothetical protein DAI22_09g099850 [Oryza sativa Japonica Group]